ncbi:hypothetical protein PLICRDRAFT_90148 [Plicaturopsis crispa FD-325 SS-3]|nr:hypothetical protein PLICRDRAFT_90148 [Plicaturopsis crispa FD-325 SS-3]
MPEARTTRSTTAAAQNPTIPEKSAGAIKKRATANTARKPRKGNPPLTNAELLAQFFPNVPNPSKIDHSFERPDLTHAQTLPLNDSVTMRVYPWPIDNGNTLLVDFVYSDGTRVDGPTDWGFWSIDGSDMLMPRHGTFVGESTHFYYCQKRGSYEVRRTDGTVLRKLSFPVQTIFE